MKIKSLKLNSFMNTFKTFMSLVFPLITYPYALRILQVNNIGMNNFANSIVSYFALVAGLGITRYATREGARKRDDSKVFNVFANQMFTLSLIATGIAYLALFISLICIEPLQPYANLILVNSMTILGTTIGMDWVNSAEEEYVYITLRTILFQIISMILLFAFVHDENDLIKYAWISVISNVGANCLNFFYIRKYVKLRIEFRGLKEHFAPVMWLFASTIATTIYVNSDTTMLGLFCGDYSVGLYSVATKIYTILKQLLAASIVVALPRLSNYWANGNTTEFKNTINSVFNTFMTLLLPIMVGVFMLAPEAIEIIGGKSYLEGVTALRILSISLGFSVIGIFYTNAMMLPMKREKQTTIIMIISAITNFILNFIFIPMAAQNGAAFTTVIAELIVMVCQIYVMSKDKVFHPNKKLLFQVFWGCLGIIVVCFCIGRINLNLVLRTILCVTGSIGIYFVILFKLKNDLVCNSIGALQKKIAKK